MRISTHKLRWQAFREALRHAFAVRATAGVLSDEDRALLERIAEQIVTRRLAGPALLFLESAGPMNFLGSQLLHFLTPIVDLSCDARDVERLARILEQRDSLSFLAALIETRAATTQRDAATVSPQ